MKTDEILEIITDACDGPVTEFVVISRAVELASRNEYLNEDISNALAEALENIKAFGNHPIK